MGFFVKVMCCILDQFLCAPMTENVTVRLHPLFHFFILQDSIHNSLVVNSDKWVQFLFILLSPATVNISEHQCYHHGKFWFCLTLKKFNTILVRFWCLPHRGFVLTVEHTFTWAVHPWWTVLVKWPNMHLDNQVIKARTWLFILYVTRLWLFHTMFISVVTKKMYCHWMVVMEDTMLRS